MKRLLSLLLSLISVICIACAFGGCIGNNKDRVRGKFCTLKQAYENGWLDEDDLKSIACCYNSAYKDNPYIGLYEEPSDKLSVKTENELKQAYLEQIVKDTSLSIDGVRVNKYYGTYKDNVVVKIYSDYMCIEPITDMEVYIGGVLFMCYWDAQTYVYHNNRKGDEEEAEQIKTGTFYTVTEAYEKGLLTREQVLSIACYHNKEYSFVEKEFYDDGLITNEEIRDENYIPLPITPQTLSAEIEKSIKQTHLDAYYKDKDYSKLSGVRIDSYYGTYNGCVAVMITDNYSGYNDALWLEEVAGIGICYNDGNRIMIWIKQ